jgi:hypothetical protein
MPTKSNNRIAKKARQKAEADFPTWLMIAKLGGFDDLPTNAQSFLIKYRARLETMGEAESTAIAIREVYSAYYVEMGGVGEAPESTAQSSDGKTVQLQMGAAKRDVPAAPQSTRSRIPVFLPALLLFASMLALLLSFLILTR